MKDPVYIYISPYDILRPRTNQLSDVRFCDGIAINNRKIYLIAPYVKRPDNININQIKEIYGTTGKTKIRILNTNFKHDVEGIISLVKILFLSYIEIIKISKEHDKDTKFIVISRNLPLTTPLLFLQKAFKLKKYFAIHWAHDFKVNKINKFSYKFCKYLIATNSSIIEDFCLLTKTRKDNTLVTSNPITEKQANESFSKIESRKITHLDKYNKNIIVYTGKLTLNFNKEINYILEAAKINNDMLFIFTGGKPQAVKFWESHCQKNNISNYLFTGYIPDYNLIKHYQRSADILISYYTNDGHDTRYNLPNKICEYMLSGNPIITPNFGATKDLLNESNCFFTKEESPVDLSNKIKEVIQNPINANKIATQALFDVRKNTFTNNTKILIDFIEQRID